jgi:hypothetical protein
MKKYTLEQAIEFKKEIPILLVKYNLIKETDLKSVLKFLEKSNFLKIPASTKYHHTHEGGNYYHSYEVMMFLRDFGLSEEFSFKVGLFHDICKIYEYILLETGGIIKGIVNDNHNHGKLSVAIIKNIFNNFTDEELTCIEYHMGVYMNDINYWNEYSEKCILYPNLILVHAADMLSCKTHRDLTR